MPAEKVTANQALFNSTVRHQVHVLRFAEQQAKDAAAALTKAEQELLEKITGTMAKGLDPARLEALLVSVKERRAQVYAQLGDSMEEQLKGMAEAEANWEVGALDGASPVRLLTAAVPLEQLHAAVAAPIAGIPLRGWLDGIATAEASQLQQAITQAVLQGQTIDDVVRRIRGSKAKGFVDGILSTSTRNAQALARTAVNHVSNQARELVWEANSDIVRCLRWTSTLDGRTSEVCRARDGHMAPIGDSSLLPGDQPLTPLGARPPAHFNCRSVLVAVLDGVELAGDRPFVKDARVRKDREAAFRAEAKSRGVPIQQVRQEWADKNVGRVPAATTYQDWLKTQPHSFQDEVLGRGKAELFRAGTPLERFVDKSGKSLNLAELKAEIAGDSLNVLQPAIGVKAKGLLMQGLTPDEVLSAIKSEFPEASTTAASIASYKSELKKAGMLGLEGPLTGAQKYQATSAANQLQAFESQLAPGIKGALQGQWASVVDDLDGHPGAYAHYKPGVGVELSNKKITGLTIAQSQQVMAHELGHMLHKVHGLELGDTGNIKKAMLEHMKADMAPELKKLYSYYATSEDELWAEVLGQALHPSPVTSQGVAAGGFNNFFAPFINAAKEAVAKKFPDLPPVMPSGPVMKGLGEVAGKPTSIGGYAKALLQQGMPDDHVLTAVLAEFLSAKTTMNSIKSYKSELKKVELNAIGKSGPTVSAQGSASIEAVKPLPPVPDKLAGFADPAAEIAKPKYEVAPLGGLTKLGVKPSIMSKKIEGAAYIDELSAAEKAALNEYKAGVYNSKAGGFSSIQRFLRTGELSSYAKQVEVEFKQIVQNLLGAFEKASTVQDITVYRGLRLKKGDAWFTAKVGDILEEKALTSTSTSKKVADKFANKLNAGEVEYKLEIVVPKGSKAIAIDDFAIEAITEKELTLAPGKFKVISISDGKMKLEYVPNAEVEVSPQTSKLLDLTKIGPKPGGTNPGAVYVDAKGDEWLVKGNKQKVDGNVPADVSDARARNEVLAARLIRHYDKALAPEMRLVDLEGQFGGGQGVMSRMLDKPIVKFDKSNMDHIKIAQRDFALHAWMGNYDVVGATFDNLVLKGGKAVNIDPGGALLFRAQGLKKTDFGPKADTWDTMRQPGTNPNAGKVYGPMTDAELNQSAKALLVFTDEVIDDMVDAMDPGLGVDLRAILKARRDDILKRTGLSINKLAHDDLEALLKHKFGNVPLSEPKSFTAGEFFFSNFSVEDQLKIGDILTSNSLLDSQKLGKLNAYASKAKIGSVNKTLYEELLGNVPVIKADPLAGIGTAVQLDVIEMVQDLSANTGFSNAEIAGNINNLLDAKYSISANLTGADVDILKGLVPKTLVPSPIAALGKNVQEDLYSLIGEGKADSVVAAQLYKLHGIDGNISQAEVAQYKKHLLEQTSIAPATAPAIPQGLAQATLTNYKAMTPKELMDALVPQDLTIKSWQGKTAKSFTIQKAAVPLFKSGASTEKIKAALDLKFGAENVPTGPSLASMKSKLKKQGMLEGPIGAAPPTGLAQPKLWGTSLGGKSTTVKEGAKNLIQQGSDAKVVTDWISTQFTSPNPAGAQALYDLAHYEVKTGKISTSAGAKAVSQSHYTPTPNLPAPVPLRPATRIGEAGPPPPRFTPEGHRAGLQKYGGAQHINDKYAVEDVNKRQLAAKLEPLTAEEYAAIKAYTNSAYGAVNYGLRSGKFASDTYLQAWSDAAMQGMFKLPHWAGDVRRGISANESTLKMLKQFYLPGSIVEEVQFTSTAVAVKGGNFSGNVMYYIKAKTGRDVRPISSHKGENEILLAPGTKFRVLKVVPTGSGMEVHLEEV